MQEMLLSASLLLQLNYNRFRILLHFLFGNPLSKMYCSPTRVPHQKLERDLTVEKNYEKIEWLEVKENAVSLSLLEWNRKRNEGEGQA